MSSYCRNWAGYSALCAVAAFSLGVSTPAKCQVSAGARVQDFGINAAIGVVTAAAWSLARGHGLTDALRNGLIGGATMAAGRQVAASPFNGSGFVGREISAAGISLITASGSDHVTVSFPIGPVRIQFKEGGALDWRVNATDAVDAIVNSVRSETRLDLGLSTSSGTFVFRDTRDTFTTGAKGSIETIGEEELGNIKLARDAFYARGEPKVLFHENVHVLQEDYFSEAVANPIENAILNRIHVSKRITRHIDLGLLSSQLELIANSAIPYSARPWEREAYSLTPLHDY
jgi:hypothetical protein